MEHIAIYSIICKAQTLFHSFIGILSLSSHFFIIIITIFHILCFPFSPSHKGMCLIATHSVLIHHLPI